MLKKSYLFEKFRHEMLGKFPRFWHYVKLLKWKFVAPSRRIITRIKGKAVKLHIDPYAVYPISTAMLKYTLFGPADVPNPFTVSGMIKGGDWDRKILPVDELDIVQSAKERFIKGVEWNKTQYYQNQLNRIVSGEQWRGCKNQEDLEAYFQRFDQLYWTIKKDGYKSQEELKNQKIEVAATAEDEITVHIDRDGHYLFCDGRHRLAVVLALGIETIPVKVCIRHAQWQEFCNEILAYAKNNFGRVYQPLPHPDLRHIPSAHLEYRYDIIRKHLPQSKGTLLDLGANWGYFCHRFEELGFDCSAVEFDPQNVYFLKKLRWALNRNFKVYEQSILTYREENRFDVILALNIFHHFLKQEVEYKALINFLRYLEIKMMIFEPHNPAEPQMIGAYRNYEPDEFCAFIMQNTGLNHIEPIGNAEDGRPLYKLWK